MKRWPACAVRIELENYLRRGPIDPAALSRLARWQIAAGAPDQATALLEKVVAANSQYPPALRQLAVLYGERSVDEANAYALVQRARQNYPEDARIAKTMGIMAYRRQLYPRSAELMEEAAKTLTDDPEHFYYLGAARRQLVQWEQSKTAGSCAELEPFG